MNESVSQPASFEHSLLELEEVVRQLEDGDTGLEQALAQYEKGIGLLKLCYGQLKDAELRIQKLTGTTADGQPVTEPFEHSATLELKQPDGLRRGRR
jgi:exodeoxyribonuclease VII small subunit